MLKPNKILIFDWVGVRKYDIVRISVKQISESWWGCIKSLLKGLIVAFKKREKCVCFSN
jgi:hypothetical protein